MTNKQQHEKVQSRNELFTERTATRIWSEQPSSDNPYITETAFCHGYDLCELMEKRSFVDVFYLLFRSELPTKEEAHLLQSLMIALINPGPRHPATRAAMNAAIGKTNPLHILPIASAVLGGDHQGGGEIESAMRFLRKQQHHNPQEFAQTMLETHIASHENSTPESIASGFGRHYGGTDLLTHKIATKLLSLDAAGNALKWGHEFASILNTQGIGWLTTGIAAAVFADLGFQPRAGGALFQLLGAPGLIAHGLELANKPITAMPFIRDENYVIER